jgi:hypothetical protein
MVVRYIQRQEIHHARINFQDEYRKLLIRHGVEFDERYVWDSCALNCAFSAETAGPPISWGFAPG